MANQENASWKIWEDQLDLNRNMNQESLYTLANGYIGMRGDLEEKLPSKYSKRGTFINGFFEMSTIPYGEIAYGYAKNMQTMLNVCDTKIISLTLDHETFTVTEGEMLSYHRELDMKAGLETREMVWKSPAGKTVKINIKRLVCLKRKHTAAIRYEVCPVDFSGPVSFKTVVDTAVKAGEDSDDPRVSSSLGDGSFYTERKEFLKEGDIVMAVAKQTTGRTKQSLICAAADVTDLCKDAVHSTGENQLVSLYSGEAKAGSPIILWRYMGYAAGVGSDKADYENKAKNSVADAVKDGWNKLTVEQASYLEEFWDKADVEILGDEQLTQSMRFNIFQLLQSVGRDSSTSIASKGLSGEGYGGHYFWESEAYIMPVFMMSQPEIARKMLEYRHVILDKAREQARLLGHESGALYSWRSIDGEESSAYYPGGSSQYHISADVAFAVYRYVDATDDFDFLEKFGLEILLETARLWINAGHYSLLKGGKFCIDDVTGPDEYTALVDNNCYTNVMARENLWNAVKYAARVRDKKPEAYNNLCEKIGFREEELRRFEEAADKMYVPYCEELGIHMQDDTFLNKKVLDLSKIPDEKRPLLLHYHPLFIYRHQVCKQADLVLAEYFLPTRFRAEDKKRDYYYYEKVTTHDSSLSACVFSAMAAEIGDEEKAYDYFIQTIRTDLDDNQKNTKDGLHMANMAGAWSCIVNGFAGLRVIDGRLSFRPILPRTWQGYRFTVTYKGTVMDIQVTKEGTSYKVRGEASMTILHHDKETAVTARGVCL